MEDSVSPNKFIETALSYTLAYISNDSSIQLSPLDITILADADYYSYSKEWKTCPLNPSSPFTDFGEKLTGAHKTGLGSSAALVTAFTSAILRFYWNISGTSISPAVFKIRVHNLSQVAHCAAQGKVGSGFDVAAAVFGSCVYRRFSPSILETVGEVTSPGFASRVKSIVDDEPTRTWDTQIEEHAVEFPHNLRLLMCDIDCGSETPGMVKEVMAWRQRFPEDAARLWTNIQITVDDLISELQELQLKPERSYAHLEEIILNNRSLIREMSANANVPIEPPSQTRLIDACHNLDGVYGGVVPGAGGFDAVVLIIEDREEVITRVKAKLMEFCNLGDEQPAMVRIMNVRQESQGLRDEPLALYSGWIQ